MDTFLLGITLFTLIVLSLVTIIIYARSKFVSSGEVSININGEKNIKWGGNSMNKDEYDKIEINKKKKETVER